MEWGKKIFNLKEIIKKKFLLVSLCKNIRRVEKLENRLETATIKVIRNTSTVVYLTRNKEEGVPWYLFVVFEKLFHDYGRCFKIRVIEFVANVPP